MLPVHVPGGIGRYARILGSILLTRFEGELHVFLQRRSDLDLVISELLPDERENFRLRPNIHLITSKYPNVARFLLNQWEIPLRFKDLNLDIYIDPDIILPPVKAGKRFLVVHDVTPFSNPAFLGLKARIVYGLAGRKSLLSAEGIICVSERSQRRIAELIPTVGHKTLVVFSCLSPKFYEWSKRGYEHHEDVCVQAEFGEILVRRPYILYVGAEGARKNLSTLLRAFEILGRRGRKHSLVMVGGKAEKPKRARNAFAPIAVPNVGNLSLPSDAPEVIKLGKVSDEDLVQLYRHADLVPLISLEEGFGYPVLESLAFRTPSLITEDSPLAEKLGPGVIKVSDPLDSELVANKIDEALKRANELSYECWSSIDQTLFSPERFYQELMEALSGKSY